MGILLEIAYYRLRRCRKQQQFARGYILVGKFFCYSTLNLRVTDNSFVNIVGIDRAADSAEFNASKV